MKYLVGFAVGLALLVGGCSAIVLSATNEATKDWDSESIEQEASNERKDLEEIKLGECDSWGDCTVSYTITNNSSKASSYDIEADVLDGGARVESAWIYEDNVKPGQTVRGETIVFVNDPNATHKLTNIEVDRMESF